MRFIIDAQLSPRLVRFFHSRGHSAEHLHHLGMNEARDRDVWRHATEMEAIVVSKDADFLPLVRDNPEGTRLLWVRVGNASAAELERILARHWDAIASAFWNGERLVELRSSGA